MKTNKIVLSLQQVLSLSLASIFFINGIVWGTSVQPDTTSMPITQLAQTKQFTDQKAAGDSASLPAELPKENKADTRIAKLETFLASHNSPLTDYAETFIQAADEYGIDWRWVPAITGTESTFGKAIPPGSFNAYGWGNGTISFSSWEESIYTVTKALSEKYVAKGADTIYKIAPIYAPPSTTWAGKVTYFIDRIENTSTSDSSDLAFSL